ncbi:restriction endonuclease [Nocardia blacklockiae]|uniref:restriction endonuclease n=1 Tax=Nocardia blacklockiae TaxID=480036 RepID=UPI0018931C6C|nr:restriction endonuclease [Nocardia blacklockiae]MBF6173586.1 restriction endonuclease [Nocardia blacklockiae]
MIISDAASVDTRKLVLAPRRARPVRYNDRDLRRFVGQVIGQTDVDALLACQLWHAEGTAARQVMENVQDDISELDEHIAKQDKRLDSVASSADQWRCTRDEFAALMQGHIEQCRHQRSIMAEALGLIQEEFSALQDRLGRDLVAHFDTSVRTESPAERVCRHGDSADRAFNTVVRSWKATCAEAAALSQVDRRRSAFLASKASVREDFIHHADWWEFEDLVARTLRRDGLTIIRDGGGQCDQGVDVIASISDGRRVAVQCKVRQSGSIAPRYLRELNGTARPVHGADIVILATNRHFTTEGIKFADGQAIHLMDGKAMRAWACWGDSLYDVLQISPPVMAS